MTQERTKERQGDGGGEPEDVEIKLRWMGREPQSYRVARGTNLKDFLRKQGIVPKGLTLYFQGKKQQVNDEGELEDNPAVMIDSLLEILRERVTGGKTGGK